MRKETFEQPDLIWSTIALIILISVVLHGATVTPVMRLIDRRRDEGVTAAETEDIKRAHGA